MSPVVWLTSIDKEKLVINLVKEKTKEHMKKKAYHFANCRGKIRMTRRNSGKRAFQPNSLLFFFWHSIKIKKFD